MNTRIAIAMTGAVGLLALASPAGAAVLTATVSGTVIAQANGDSAFDIGVFSSDFQLLGGQVFSVAYSFDLDDATFAGSVPGPFSPAVQLLGGAWSPAPSAAFGRAALTIGGTTVSFEGISLGLVSAGTGERTFDVFDFSRPGVIFTAATNLFDATNAFPAGLESAGTWSGSFDRAADLRSANPSSFFVAFGDGRFALGGLAPTSLRVAISAVPETSNWVMMIAGLGAVAWALRRPRARVRDVGFASRTA
ncbi:hypothetical protein ACT009_17015 [Sphingomonas sp. Tas61C01]|uniref:hypothetical protein n=1 Tax=Sphingomonas sp. Tas61C01 TaxID=3458297 RepID=UPI00403E620F